MELPNYSQQLLRQLYAFCKEQQFCDCSILVGASHFRAHKVVLAAASLLLRSLLESTDTISIDASVVAPDDFALLLEMIYTGRLPLGKHNFTKIISAADNLQMFDVAVSCKALLRDLLSCSDQDHVGRDFSIQTIGTPSESSAILNSSQAAVLDANVAVDSYHSVRVSSGSADSVNPVRVQGQNTHSAYTHEEAVDQEATLPNSCSQDSEICLGQSPDGQGICEERESTEPSEERGMVEGAARWNLEAFGKNLLRRHRVTLARFAVGPQLLQKGLAAVQHLAAGNREVMEKIATSEAGSGLLAALASAALEEQTLSAAALWQVLLALQDQEPSLKRFLKEVQKEADADLFFQAELLAKGEGGEVDILQRPVEKESQLEAAGEEEKEQKAEPTVGAAPKRSFTCKACRKSFRFYCRLQVHEKRCRVASQTQAPHKDCSEARASMKELEKCPQETPGSASRKKKKRLPVACDICGREFAHASGMQYHKLTEHFDEKPFSCDECGAKFAANSTLKNHQRLHSGDRPFVCKHCPTTFSQASALAYHTKKKHAEGKMYACQYCAAVFAQSIELSRHVRTHTGDKPYVCRECGKGFRQANGLSIHLRTFHNIDDPYDCKKCQMSFPTLQEHRKHIHTAHSREYHPCPTCGKVFSAPSLLERHIVTHAGGKPFSCEICDKAYQQLSGLWYHNRTHHPDIFAAQNHRSSKFSSLQCSSCDKTFLSTAAYRKQAKEEHAETTAHECEQCGGFFLTLASLQVHTKRQHSGSQPFLCPHCSASFHLQEALQHHVAAEHATQAEPSLGCGLCGELFTGQEQLEEHCEAEHPKVVFTGSQVPAAHIVQVIQAPEQVIALTESELASSHVFLTLPDAQGYQGGTELVTVTMEDLLDEKVTLICKEVE
uniref:zinc finger and BTB domain-containing protein 40-like n=1 Tax=Euleptes europaea TaxID=460621 RepID=UPI0025402240|nr:zinc finger and BTB domain-containing protein 40-like [Euleptes europaea]